MRYGLTVLNFWDLGEPRTIQQIARAAEASGWDGLFVWDHVSAPWAPGVALFDPWTLLAGAACVTERLLIGTNVTPLPRRRPHVLAMQVATVDHLSDGRAILGVGLGGEESDYLRFGEEFDARVRAEKLDEALEVITALWSGQEVHHRGPHYLIDGVRNLAAPVGRVRCPIWIGGNSRGAQRRAARWDGWTISTIADPSGRIGLTPAQLATDLAYVLEHRTSDEPFDCVVEGYTEPDQQGVELAAAYETVGATWWCDSLNGLRGSVDQLIARVHAGPPRS